MAGDGLKMGSAEAVQAHKLATARARWNALAEEQRQLCQRMTKSLREVRSWWEKLREGARAMEALGAILGHPATWARAERRLLVNHARLAMMGLVPEIPYTAGGNREVAEVRLCDAWPFAQPMPAAPAPEDEP